MSGRSFAGSVISAEILSVTLDGSPSCVHAAEILVIFRDGSSQTVKITYEPDGVMFEVLEYDVRMFRKRFGGR